MRKMEKKRSKAVVDEIQENIDSNSPRNSSLDLYSKEKIDDEKIDKKKGRGPSKLNLKEIERCPSESHNTTNILDDAISLVFGKEARGRVRGMSFGVTPSKVEASVQQNGTVKRLESSVNNLQQEMQEMSGVIGSGIGNNVGGSSHGKKSGNNQPLTVAQDEYGITFYCVDIYKQPAFDHPLLKNHTLQIKSTSFPKSMNNNSSSEILKLPRRCPQGTVPIRRTTKEDLIRAKQIQQTQLIDLKDTNVPTNGYSAGVTFSTRNGPAKFYGISADLDVYHLSGILDDQTSATQIIVSKGETGPMAYHNVLQAGFITQLRETALLTSSLIGLHISSQMGIRKLVASTFFALDSSKQLKGCLQAKFTPWTP
ncbi:hypothetical protein ZIOFF_043399 [Zingiber officinale]|uniref:Neprosin activation peptide domain-containing protein n=1 Tax=Zingiber officinale TaxID=94328 RepID=A0A8J5FUV6_ZINOF|nr:hypothetical protein ZIOFF_043399 [Zingiber officinale]